MFFSITKANAEIARLQTEAAAREKVLAEVQKTLAERDGTIATLNTDIAARDKTITDLKADLKAAEEHVQEFNKKVGAAAAATAAGQGIPAKDLPDTKAGAETVEGVRAQLAKATSPIEKANLARKLREMAAKKN